MNVTEQIEMIKRLMDLEPTDQADVMQFIRVRFAARAAALRPPNAYTWSRLAEWQKKKIYYAVRFAKFRFEAVKYLRALFFFRSGKA